jgi:integrase
MIRRGAQFLDGERLGSAWTDTGLVFTTRSGPPVEPRNLNRSFERICDANGIRRVKVHVLRHTTASLLKALGVPPKDARVVLGHAHASTTEQIYVHVDEAAKRDALTKLNRLLGGSDDQPHRGQQWWSCPVLAGVVRMKPQVELRGLEPLTLCLQSRCSSS